MKKLQKGDIVQIVDKSNKWFPCLMIVSEIRAGGVQGYTYIPAGCTNAPADCAAYYGIANGKYEKVGTAAFIAEWNDSIPPTTKSPVTRPGD